MHGISGRRSGTQRHPDLVQRVVVLGPGGPGKTTAAKQLGRLLQVPVFELDEMFWSTDLAPTPPQRWASLQFQLAVADRWVMDGDLGPMTSSNRGWPADTVVLDFGLVRCLWRAARRSWERLDFWWWVITWCRRARPGLLVAVATYAPQDDLHIVSTPRELQRLLRGAGT